MTPINMSDIYGQYLTMKEEIDAAMQEVIRSTQFIKSGKSIEFENKLSAYLNTNVIAMSELEVKKLVIGELKNE